jgi:nicotinate-nucleotide adenylyltransferase
MKIGLYFGSFNPVHVGHLIIADYMACSTPLEQVWMVVSPQNPLKPSGTLLNEYDRLYLMELAVEKAPHLRASNIEFGLPRPSYTIDTVTYLQEKFPDHEFSIVLGSDSLGNIRKWKNYEQLLERCPLYVYPRPGKEADNPPPGRIHYCDAPLLEISSSLVRRMLAEGRSVRYLVSEPVYEYILANRYYQPRTT